jgi:hypothetical protein
VRYNISENDGLKGHFSGICLIGSARQSNTRIHNNTIFNSEGRKAISGDDQAPDSFFIYDNICTLRGNGSFTGGLGKAVILGNLSWNYDGEGIWEKATSMDDWRAKTGAEMRNGAKVGFYQDPLLTSPGSAEHPTDPAQLESLVAYKLKKGSPCFGQALDPLSGEGIQPGMRDFFGAALPATGKRDIGAHQQAGTERK